MTNESISGFLNSIAEAKRAFDAEPDYQRQIRDLERDKQRLGDVVAQRELRIHELKQKEETLTQALRSVEVERDDAGFRALEETDKVQNLLTLVRQYVGDGLKAISAVEGKESIIVNKVDHDDDMTTIRKQEEEIVGLQQACDRLQRDMRMAQEQFHRPFVSDTSSLQDDTTDHSLPKREWNEDGWGDPQPSQGQREVDPTAVSHIGSESHPVASGSAETAANADGVSSSNEGQSDGPFASTVDSQPSSASSTTAESITNAASHASQPDWKQDQAETSRLAPERNRDRSTFFTGRKYYDVTYFVPLHQWLNEGGTEADYHWRPAEGNVPTQFNRASHQS